LVPGLSLRERLAAELADYLPAEAVRPLMLDQRAFGSSELADRAIRALAPRALEVSGATEAAARIRALPPITGAETARSTMPALERIGHASRAPSEQIRAASQIAAALIRESSPQGAEQGATQLVAAIVRLAASSVRAGIQPEEVVAVLRDAGAGTAGREV
jgi:hypothetical protein